MRLGDPRRPSEQEVEDHCLSGHLPYRNWCYHCVRGRGRDLDHRKGIEEERGLSEFSFDYCFPGDEFGFKLTILAGSERATGMKMATVVPEKGSSGRFSAGKCLEFMEECGDGNCDVIVKTDQEPSIGILVQDIKEMRESRTVVEESPVGSHQSNGIIERSVQGVEGQLRVLKSALEGRIGKRISAERRIVKFMAEYGAYLLNRLEVGKDGKTAYERVRGKKGRVLGVEFGEKLLWKVRPKERLEKIQPRWEYGIFVGVKRKGGEVWVATKEGGMKAVRSVRRIPVEERWGEDCLDWVKNVPWNRGDGGETDGEIPEEKLEEPGERQEENEGLKGVVFVNTREKEPREFYISKEDGEKYGYTRGCGGCSSWFKGLGRQPHTEACRERFN